jgi:predicted  nucleic acid-binding Zn-ribbon protein
MAEVEYKGIKIGGSKLLLILPLLGTIAGGLWGGFELWTRYQAMEVKIAKYVAPDLSGFDKRIAIVEKTFEGELSSLRAELKTIQDSVVTASDYTRDIKNDLKGDITIIEKTIDDVERRGKEAFKLVRDSIEVNDTKVRDMVTVSSDRFDNRREQIRNDMDNLEKRIKTEMKELKDSINDKIKKALENPLANMRK